MLTPGMSRERASEAAAVIGLEWVCCVLRKWSEAEDKADKTCMNGSKCSLRRSNPGCLEQSLRVSGVGLERFVLLDVYGTCG